MAINLTSFHSLSSQATHADVNYEDGNCYSNTLRFVVNIHSMFLIIFGFIANLCSFVVLIRPRLRRRPTFSYLAFLSLSNALLSLIYAGFAILAVNFDKVVDDLPLFLCCRLLNRFAIDFFTHFSLFTLTAVDLDRVRTVTAKVSHTQRYNHANNDRSHGCSRAFKHVCLIELFIALFLFILNFHWLISYGYIEQDPYGVQDRTKCDIPEINNETMFNPYAVAYDKYLMSILPIIELVLFNVLPFSISTIATIVILRHVSIKYTLLNDVNKRLKKSRRRMELHLSILLISLNFVFIVFNTPHNIFAVYAGQVQSRLMTTQEGQRNICLISTLQKSFDLLQQCYFMSTFFLYILTNRRFREEFYELLKRNLFLSCGTITTTHSSTPITSHTRHHHHHHRRRRRHSLSRNNDCLEHQQSMDLARPLSSAMDGRLSITDYASHDAYEDDEVD
jgi:hypothetical protein